MLVEVLSEKATHDLEAPASGILRKILVREGVDAQVNAVLAIMTARDESFSEAEIISKSPSPSMSAQNIDRGLSVCPVINISSLNVTCADEERGRNRMSIR